MKTIDSISQFLRAVAAVGFLGLLGAGGWLGYSKYYQHEIDIANRDQAISKLEGDLKQRNDKIQQQQEQLGQQIQQIQQQEVEIQRLDTALQLLKVDQRVAQIEVLEQTRNEEDGVTASKVKFTEVNPEGYPIGKPKVFDIEGDVVWLDTWVATFQDKYIEQGDPLRGASICLLKRIFGDNQAPADGFPLDENGGRPLAYDQGGAMSDLERDIWSNFWEYANNPDKAEAAGLRTVHGDGPHIKVREGKLYKLQLRSSGGWSFEVEDAK